MTPLIKICGITNRHDAQIAIEAGCDFIGIIFADHSPRRVSTITAQQIIHKLPKSVKLVGVFQNQPAAFVTRVAAQLNLDYVQLHGQESADYCRDISLPVIKTFESKSTFTYQQMQPYLEHISAAVFDYPKTAIGNNDINPLYLARSYPPDWPPLMLAGRLDISSLHNVIKSVNPWAVDVASGVESSPGIKDAAKVKVFCQIAKEETTCVCQENSESSVGYMYPKP